MREHGASVNDALNIQGGIDAKPVPSEPAYFDDARRSIAEQDG